MRIRIEQYDVEKDRPVYPGRESYRKRELRLLKVLTIILIIVVLFGTIYLYTKMQHVHERECYIKEIIRVTSGTKYKTVAGLNLQIEDEYYYLDGDYIYNDGERFKIDHIEEMVWLLESEKVMNKEIQLQYLQLNEYDKPIIIGAFCGEIGILNMDYSMEILYKKLYFNFILGTITVFLFVGIYLFRKKYSFFIVKGK